MKKTLLIASLAALGLATAGEASATPVNLVQNGNFSAPSLGGLSWRAYANGLVPGWTNTANNDGIEIDSPGAIGASSDPAGATQSAELNGSTFDTISQTITGLTVGASYLLTWYYGYRPNSGPQQMNVLFGGNLVQTDTDPGTNSFSWHLESAVVRATSTTEVLSFQAVNIPGANPSVGNELTGVSLFAVPEPGSIGLLGLALTALGIGRRKKA